MNHRLSGWLVLFSMSVAPVAAGAQAQDDDAKPGVKDSPVTQAQTEMEGFWNPLASESEIPPQSPPLES